jgi:hypothetical protein
VVSSSLELSSYGEIGPVAAFQDLSGFRVVYEGLSGFATVPAFYTLIGRWPRLGFSLRGHLCHPNKHFVKLLLNPGFLLLPALRFGWRDDKLMFRGCWESVAA